MSDPLAGWTPGSFTGGGYTRTTYRKGTGPGVVVIHEIPGITPNVARFADDVVAAGFTVVMPSLVGTPGREPTVGYGLRSMLRACVAREFTTWALGQTSPIIGFLRALAKDLHAECGGPGVGALGMCLTGGFALGMMVDGHVAAPVLSQPSLPLPMGRKRRADLNVSPADLAGVKARAAEGCAVLGLRFDKDPWVGDRFDTLRRELGPDGFVAVELPSAKKSDHSVVTEHRHEPTVQQVLQFFRDRLQ